MVLDIATSTEFDCDLCEETWLLGGTGECAVDVFNQSFCKCPEGFTTIDDMSVHQACQVNITLAFVIHLIVFIISVIGLVVSVVYLVLLWCRWRFKLCPCGNQSTQNGPPVLTMFRKPAIYGFGSLHVSQQVSIEQSWKRKRDSIIICCCATGSNLLACCMELPFLLPVQMFHSKNNTALRFSVYDGSIRHLYSFLLISMITISSGVSCYMLLAAYHSLPSVKLYGGLMKVSPILRNNPRFLYQLIVVKTVVFLGILLTLLIAIPAWLPASKPYLARLLVFVYLLSFLIYIVMNSIIISNIVRIYRHYIETLQREQRRFAMKKEGEKIAFENAILSANRFKVASKVTYVLGIAGGIVFLCLQGRYEFLFLEFFWLHLRLAMIAIPVIIYRQTNGGWSPVTSRNPGLSRRSTVSSASKASKEPGTSPRYSVKKSLELTKMKHLSSRTDSRFSQMEDML